jgi:hypothetical protein
LVTDLDYAGFSNFLPSEVMPTITTLYPVAVSPLQNPHKKDSMPRLPYRVPLIRSKITAPVRAFWVYADTLAYRKAHEVMRLSSSLHLILAGPFTYYSGKIPIGCMEA